MTLRRSHASVSRRAAFTLLEVLVVVAIILVLASVATVATMSYLEDAKINKTKMNLKTVEKVAEGVITNNGGNVPDDLMNETMRKLRNGPDDLLDGWGNQMSISVEADPNTGNQRVKVVANTPNGPMTSWDR